MGTVEEEQARLRALNNPGESLSIGGNEYDPRGRYIPQSGTGTWRMSGSGAGMPPPPSRQDVPEVRTETWEPTKEMPTLGPVEPMDLPEMGELPTLVTPEMGELPTYVRPEWEEDEITRLAQVRGAAGMRNLRTAVQAISRQRAESPHVRRMTLRDALKGYGEGLEAVMSGATGAARAEYGQRYAAEAQERQINYNTAVQAVRDIYSADLHTASANFQAKVENIRMVYGNEVAAEMMRVAETNTQNRIIFDASMADYFKTGVTTETTGGVGAGAAGGGVHGSLEFRQRVYDALYANVSRINPYYDQYMHTLGVQQLGAGRPTI